MGAFVTDISNINIKLRFAFGLPYDLVNTDKIINRASESERKREGEERGRGERKGERRGSERGRKRERERQREERG